MTDDPKTALKRSIVPNDHFARFLGYLALAFTIWPWSPSLWVGAVSGAMAGGALYHLIRWRQDLSKAKKAEAARKENTHV